MKSIKETPNETLELIVKTHGIRIIKDFVKNYNKKARKKKTTRQHEYDEIAIRVYQLIMNEDYGVEKAYERIADECGDITQGTVKNHYTKFNDIAKEEDYYSFGAIVEEFIHDNGYVGYEEDEALRNIASLNEIDYETAKIYYFKYHKDKKDKKSKKIKTINYEKFKRFEIKKREANIGVNHIPTID